MEKIAGGWSTDRVRFSEDAIKVFDVAINHRRLFIKLSGDTVRGVRFNEDKDILARIESRFTEKEFMECPWMIIDSALVDAAQADHWYLYEKKWDDNYDMEDDTEIIEDEE